MITTLLFDFSRVLLFPKDPDYQGELNRLHQQLSSSSQYSFSDHFRIDEQLLDYLGSIKSKFDLNIFTSGSIQNVPEIRPTIDKIFQKIISASDIGLSKKDPNAYLEVARLIGKSPDEILFFDDSPENVSTAQIAGLKAVVYESPYQTIKIINEIINNR